MARKVHQLAFKELGNLLISKIKNTFQLLFDEQTMGNFSQKIKRQLIVYNVCHVNARFCLHKMMFVMPDVIRTHTLFIYKKLSFGYMRNLRHPKQGNAQNGRHFISNNLTGINVLREVGAGYLKIHVFRCDGSQILGIGEESPDLFEAGLNRLFVLQPMYRHNAINETWSALF